MGAGRGRRHGPQSGVGKAAFHTGGGARRRPRRHVFLGVFRREVLERQGGTTRS